MRIKLFDLPMKAQVLILILTAILVAQALMVAAVMVVPPPKREAYFLSDIAEVLRTPAEGARFNRPIDVRIQRDLPSELAAPSPWDQAATEIAAKSLGIAPERIRVKIMRRALGWNALVIPPGGYPAPPPAPGNGLGVSGEPLPPPPPLAQLPIRHFVAALRQDDGTWRIAEPAPVHDWAIRILVWIAAGMLVMGPIAWWFADGITRPLDSFARAAEKLGSDPTAPALADQGPAEVGVAARAFNDMQSRLSRYVMDRLGMLGAISHDLRSPLTRIRFRVESVAEPARSDVLGDVAHMEQMIDLLLGYVRGVDHAAPRERLALNALVGVAVEEANLVGHRIVFLDQETTEPAVVEADLVAMRNVLDNLLQNAVKYGDRAEVEVVVSGREAIVRIQDFGPGIPEMELERVFQPFYRVERPGADTPGVGLGLATSRSVVRAHGGDVVLSNSPEGLLAQLILPLKRDGWQRRGQPAAERAGVTGRVNGGKDRPRRRPDQGRPWRSSRT